MTQSCSFERVVGSKVVDLKLEKLNHRRLYIVSEDRGFNLYLFPEVQFKQFRFSVILKLDYLILMFMGKCLMSKRLVWYQTAYPSKFQELGIFKTQPLYPMSAPFRGQLILLSDPMWYLSKQNHTKELKEASSSVVCPTFLLPTHYLPFLDVSGVC